MILTDTTPYYLVDGQTHKVIRTYVYRQRAAALRQRDKLDNAYGGYRYVLMFNLPKE